MLAANAKECFLFAQIGFRLPAEDRAAGCPVPAQSPLLGDPFYSPDVQQHRVVC